ncbi:hypothetical protein BKN38_07565 [Helicobacter sp. CLO-3]|uniref:LolA-like outer membrane lipoprotein chaperone n=1 Tax=unclassified Helicobacter TaxID=2593540 RepID=UPI000804C5FF|nr:MULTISPECIES: LolA-like outer membrane lipoprotein chaperone [unclassified Helicobacter]OBV29325.1 hypothetical protein BA723_05840 [Helicobacter sp. CLO-3]OHU82107.1 hypothetical protein BKN38_07565 [Helicobacter sp. CLO-3]
MNIFGNIFRDMFDDAFSEVLRICFLCALAFGFSYAFGEHIQTFKANFVQKTTSQDNILSYSGQVLAKIPAKAKWLYQAPTEKEIYINDTETIVYEPFLEQASIGQAKRKIDFLQILRQAELQPNGTYRAIFEGTEYILSLKNDKPYRLTFSDEFENSVEIIFQDVRINEPIDDAEFIFIAPPNIDIIR